MLYRQRGKYYFIPVLRERLTFSIVVQRVAKQLQLGPADVIAVELPNSVGLRISEALREPDKFLDVRLVMTRDAKGPDFTPERREVFPVTPSDAVVEAVRLGKSLGIAVEYIDQPILPSRLPNRGCHYEFDLPDDSLVITEGEKWYFDQVGKVLSYHRNEDIDSARDAYMAARLRSLGAEDAYERIIVVCSADQVDHVISHLDGASTEPSTPPLNERDRPAGGTSEEPIAFAPALAAPLIARAYLDEIPKVTEAYEARRSNLGGADFDKALESRRLIINHLVECSAGAATTRVVSTFALVLDRLLASEGRRCPRLIDVERAVDLCFERPRTFWNDLEEALLSYGSRGIVHSPSDSQRQRKQVDDNGEHIEYILRFCGPFPPSPIVFPVPVDMVDPKAWPPYKRHVNEMRREANLCQELVQRPGIVPFRGTLERGIDLRRTIRGITEVPSKLYVRTARPRAAAESIDEPVAWLIGNAVEPGHGTIWFGIIGEGNPKYVGAEFWSRELSHPKNRRDVEMRHLVGMITFCDIGVPLDKVGESITSRVPHGWTMPMAENGGPWWETLAKHAAQYARRKVVCVVLPSFKDLAGFRKAIQMQGKQLVVVPAGGFDPMRLIDLAHMPWVQRPHPPKNDSDTNDESYEAEVEKRYSELMGAGIWPPRMRAADESAQLDPIGLAATGVSKSVAISIVT